MNDQSISCACPHCGRRYRVPTEWQGRKVPCKGCQSPFVVQPVPAPAAAAQTGPLATAATASATQVRPLAAAATASAGATAPRAAATPAAPPSSTASAPDLGLIPFDENPVPLTSGDPSEGSGLQTISTRVAPTDKVKISSSGPYFVVKLVLQGKMIHVGIENTLNEHATEGWRLKEILQVGTEAYAVLYRDPSEKKPEA